MACAGEGGGGESYNLFHRHYRAVFSAKCYTYYILYYIIYVRKIAAALRRHIRVRVPLYIGTIALLRVVAEFLTAAPVVAAMIYFIRPTDSAKTAKQRAHSSIIYYIFFVRNINIVHAGIFFLYRNIEHGGGRFTIRLRFEIVRI